MNPLFQRAIFVAVGFAAVGVCCGVAATRSPAFAAAPDARSVGAVAGSVTGGDGVPVRDASVSLQGAGATQFARTDAAGHFSLAQIPSGTYAVRVSALGYDPLAPRTIGVSPAQTTQIALALVRSSSSLATIGRVVANGGEAFSTSSAPVSIVNAQSYAAQGYTRISDVLQDDMSATLVHPLGGSTVLPTSVALRGPDPTETLVDIDGHQVNNGNTGDFDLSLLDPADYGSIELVRGISPSSLVGPNTIDGAINIRTLEPTLNPHGLLRLSAGSFNSFGETLQTTGTQGRLGYAFSLHRTTTNGGVNGAFDAGDDVAQLGSGVDGSTALAKLRYAFGRGGDAYAQLSFHDQSMFRDLSAGLSSYGQPETADASDAPGQPVLDSFAGSALAAHNAGYGLDVRVPIGSPDAGDAADASLLFRHYSSLVSQSVSGPGAQTSPYLYNDRDLTGDDSLEFDRRFSNGALTVAYDVRSEDLATDFVAGVVNDQAVVRRDIELPAFFAARRASDSDTSVAAASSRLRLGQTQRAAVLKYAYDPTAKLHLTAATYYSDYSTFGHNLDPRFGFVFTPDSRSAFRFSVGSTFQAPQLPELFVPSILPAPAGGYVSIGNPNLRPDQATEYGLGASHVFETGSHRTELALDVYRVNLRTPAATYFGPGDPADCTADGGACPLSYPVNAGDAVYQGVELSGQRRLTRDVSVRAGYAIRSAFLTSIPLSIQDGSLVPNEQILGLPLQKATFTVQAAPPVGVTFGAGLVYEGKYNELNSPPFATLAASIGYRWPSVELIVSGTNLTDVYDRRFTLAGQGVPYGGAGQTILTDAYALAPTAINVSLSRRF